LQQVVWNLVSNSVKFTPSGGQVKVELKRHGDSVTIAVTDTGIGIREDLLPRIFERFSQGESGATRRHGGLGLGLAIARQLVELHCGSISAASGGEGQGATFTIHLPLRRERIDSVASPAHPALERLNLTGLRVLLVEDEASSREGTRTLLQAYDAKVQACESVREAKEAYMLQRPDIIVSDIGMPEEDGYAFLQHIRHYEQQEGLTRVPSLALTAFARTEDRERSAAAGFDAHLAKPVDPDGLIETIAQLTGRLTH
jgi:CheY-like chemotaxis protein